MKHSGKVVLMVLMLGLLQGCALMKAKTKPAPTAQAPTTTTDQTGALYPPPFPEKTVPPPAPEPQSTQAETTLPTKPVQQKELHPKKKNSSKAKPSAGKPATASTAGGDTTGKTTASGTAGGTATGQQAENVEPSGVSPIGQLSSGEAGSGSQKRHETSDLITNTEQGLNGIKRNLTATEKETVMQIRTYLKQAKQALTVDDLDGASTLATKAKVLLEELTKP